MRGVGLIEKSKQNYIRMKGTNSRKMYVEMTLINNNNNNNNNNNSNNNNNNSRGIYVQMQAIAVVFL